MSTRKLIAASLLLGSACVAHADVLPASGTAQSGFLSGWTSGNGTDVVSSGVLDSGSTLIGGVSHGSGNLAETLYQKASASIAQGSEFKLSYSQGIEGSYLVGMSNAKLAALLGNGVSVVGSGDGVTISQGQTGANAGAGIGAGAGGSANPGASANAGANVNAGAGNNSAGGVGEGVGGGKEGNNGIAVGVGGGTGIDLDTPVSLPPQAQVPGDVIVALPAAPAAAVPEPSTLALLMAGVLGTFGLGRRRQR